MNFIDTINHLLNLYFVLPVIFVVGCYLTAQIGCIQLTKFFSGFISLVKKDKTSDGDLSHFEVLSAVLAGNLGTGNISGMAIALSSGGPGALVWMWMMAFLGTIIQFAGCFLGVKFRHRNEDGEFVGGPMYYLKEGLNAKALAGLFAFFAMVTAFTVGNIVQVNSISLPLEEFSPLLIGVLIAMIVATILIGGMSRFALFASTVVPLMAGVYLITALSILFMNRAEVIPAISLLFSSAFDFSSIAGGAAGYGLATTLRVGFERGIFATDAGTGIGAVLQASARTKSPVEEGLVAMVAPFVVMIMCTITALVLIVTGAWQVEGLQSTKMCVFAFEQGTGSVLGKYVVLISLFLFALTTILAWANCAERAVEYLFGLKWVKTFHWLFTLVIPMGALIHVELAWKLADISIALMLLCNLVGVIGLSPMIIRESRKFFGKEVEHQSF